MMDLLQYTFFQNALLGALFASIACGNYWYLYCYPPTGVYNRRAYSCIVWWRWYRALYGYIAYSFGCHLFSIVRLWSKLAQPAEGYARRLGHCSVLDYGYGVGYYFYLSFSRFRTRPLCIPFRQYPYCYQYGHYYAGGFTPLH